MKIIHYACVLCLLIGVGACAETQDTSQGADASSDCGDFDPEEFKGSWKIYRTEGHMDSDGKALSEAHLAYGTRLVLEPYRWNWWNKKKFKLTVPSHEVKLTATCKERKYELNGGEIDAHGCKHAIYISRPDDPSEYYDEKCDNEFKKEEDIWELCQLVTNIHYDRHIKLDFKDISGENCLHPEHPGHTHGGSSEG